MEKTPTIREIFAAAIEIDSQQERAKYLDEVCVGDAALRAEIEGLIQAHFDAGSFFTEEYGATLGETVATGHKQLRAGAQIGPYKLLQQIGEGGMGEVYMAEQSRPIERRVAIKIIKAGMDTRQVIARFEAERQALALMEHPNIARVFDAGSTESGQPYFVMELVKGTPITQYCDEHRLNPTQRLKLFQDVCNAIQHAHQKGIIHRDLKPSNVLVAEYDDVPVPKVIDFGVAKATQQRLTEKTMFTEIGTVVGTVEYMSPEQAKLNALDIDTRSDVYSLGIILYELLTGEPPFDRKRLRSAALDEMLRIIREVEPSRPSIKLNSSEALPSVAANRHVDPRRLSLLVRGELDWIVMKAIEKERNRRYETPSAFADDIGNYLDGATVSACPPSPVYRLQKFFLRNKTAALTSAAVVGALLLGMVGTSWQAFRATRAEWLAVERLQSEQEARNEAVSARQAEADQRSLAEAARDRAEENLKLVATEQKRAEQNLDLALKALDAVYLEAIGKKMLLGNSGARQNEGDSSERHLSDLEKELLLLGLDLYDQLSKDNASTDRAAATSAAASYRVGLLHLALGNNKDAESAAGKAVERYKLLVPTNSANQQYIKGLAQSYQLLANCNPWRPHARDTFQKAEEMIGRALALDPTDASLFSMRGDIRRSTNDLKGALSDYSQAIELDPDDVVLLARFAFFLRVVQDPKLRDYDRSLQYALIAVERDPDWAYPHIVLTSLYEVNFKDFEKALQHANEAVRLDPSDAGALRWRARVHQRLGDFDSALADFNRSIELRPTALCLKDRASILRRNRQFEEALADYDLALKLNPNEVYVYEERGSLFMELDRYQDALDDFNKAAELAPKRSWLYKRRAVAFFRLKRFKDCVADLELAFELNPGDLSTLSWIAPNSVVSSDDEEFKTEMLKLMDVAIKHPEADQAQCYRRRAALLNALGEPEKAEADMQMANEIAGRRTSN